MANTRKRTAEPERIMPREGDKVKPPRSEMVYEISRVSPDGSDVDLHVPGRTLKVSACEPTA